MGGWRGSRSAPRGVNAIFVRCHRASFVTAASVIGSVCMCVCVCVCVCVQQAVFAYKEKLEKGHNCHFIAADLLNAM